jgi:heptosyltransferase II
MEPRGKMKILFWCLPGIGDALMATPTIKLLKEKIPDAEIDIACMFEGVRYVFKNNENINVIHTLSLYKKSRLKGFAQLLELRKHNYDVSIMAYPAYRAEYNIVQWFVGAKKRVAHEFARGFWREFRFLNTDLVKVDENEHNVLNDLNLLRMLGISWQEEVKREDIKYDFILDKEDIAFGKAYIDKLGWENKNIVGIHPGSTISPAALLRRWPVERYAAVAKFLTKEKRKKIFIFIGPDEAELGQKLADLIGDSTNCRVVSGLEFGQTVGILNQVAVLLCNDNGFGHVAVALGKKILTLWASTNDRWSLPYSRELVTLVRPENFEPWYRYDLKRSIPRGIEGGIKLISVNSVIQKINNLT